MGTLFKVLGIIFVALLILGGFGALYEKVTGKTLDGGKKKPRGGLVRNEHGDLMDPETGEVLEDDGPFNSLREWRSALKELWRGDMPIEFTYRKDNERNRRKVQLKEVLVDERGRTYFYGFCELRQDYRHFKTYRIETKIKVGSKRYDMCDFFHDCLGVEEPMET